MGCPTCGSVAGPLQQALLAVTGADSSTDNPSAQPPRTRPLSGRVSGEHGASCCTGVRPRRAKPSPQGHAQPCCEPPGDTARHTVLLLQTAALTRHHRRSWATRVRATGHVRPATAQARVREGATGVTAACASPAALAAGCHSRNSLLASAQQQRSVPSVLSAEHTCAVCEVVVGPHEDARVSMREN